MYPSGELFMCSQDGYKHQNNTRVSALKVRHESTYITLFLTRYNESINHVNDNDLHTLSLYPTRSAYVLLMTLQSIADDLTMTWQLWRDHMNSDI